MSVRIDTVYEGDLHCRTTHVPSRASFETDAPVDNQGRGESYSPTDLVATALGTCMLTTMGIVAKRHGWKIDGATASVEKHMVADPDRRVGKLVSTLHMPAGFGEKERTILERTAHTCPVKKSLHPSVETPVIFHWGESR